LIPAVGAFGALGFFFWLARMDRRKLLLLLLGGVYTLAVCLATLIDRYLLPVLPLAASWVAAGLLAVPVTISGRGLPFPLGGWIGRFPLRAAVIGVMAVLQCLVLVKAVPVFFRDRPVEYQAAAAWLASRSGPEASVMASKPHVAFFGGLRNISYRYDVRLQDHRLEELPAILEKVKPTYLIFDQRHAAAEFPRFRALLDPHTNPYPALLERVFDVDSPKRLVIYRYTGAGHRV
jgi:hypothetical protein